MFYGKIFVPFITLFVTLICTRRFWLNRFMVIILMVFYCL